MKNGLLALLGMAAFLVAIPFSYADETYPPGTIGYLYEDCKKAVKAESIKDFQASWCGAFIEGYKAGAFSAAMMNHHKQDYYKPRPQCEQAAQKERENIRNPYICPHLRYLMAEAGTPINIIKGLPIWIEWEKKNAPGILNHDLAPHINKAIKSPDFCEYAIAGKFKTQLFSVNPALANLDERTWEKTVRAIPLPEIHEREDCKPETLEKMDESSFAKSTCGAATIGMFAGMYLTDTPARAHDPECAEDINAIRKQEIAARQACLPETLTTHEIKKLISSSKNMSFCEDQASE